jgi:hypothetical protein
MYTQRRILLLDEDGGAVKMPSVGDIRMEKGYADTVTPDTRAVLTASA